MNNLVLSIIIPAYNAEKYIKQCLYSILYQNIDNSKYEIICIDDGSTDNTAEKINEVKKVFNNKIIYISKQNSGVSETRNLGIKKATGKYIWFIDSDDYIENNKLGDIIKVIESDKKDIFMVGFNYVDEVGKIIKKEKYYNDSNRYNEILVNGRMNNVWQLIISREFLKKYNIYFNSNYIIAEDMLFNLDMISKNPSIEFIDNYVYNYRNNKTGIMNSIDEEKVYQKIYDVINAYFKYYDYLKKWNIDNKCNRNLVSIKFFYMLNSELKNIIKLKINKKEKFEWLKKILSIDKVKFAKANLVNKKKLKLEQRLLVNNHIYLYYNIRKFKDELNKIKKYLIKNRYSKKGNKK